MLTNANLVRTEGRDIWLNDKQAIELANLPGMSHKESWLAKNTVGFKRVKGFRPKSASQRPQGYSFPTSAELGADMDMLKTFDDASAYNLQDQEFGESKSPHKHAQQARQAPKARPQTAGAARAAHTAESKALAIAQQQKANEKRWQDENMPRHTTHSTDDRARTSERLSDSHARNNATGKLLPNVPFLEAAAPPNLRRQDELEKELRKKHQNHELAKIYEKKGAEHIHPADETGQILREQISEDPDFSDETKLVCRYTGYFLQERVWEEEPVIGAPVVEDVMVRKLFISYYVHDSTISIFEKHYKNVGLDGGNFFSKGFLLRDDREAERVTVHDLVPGSSIKALGIEIFITDADTATRSLCKKTWGTELPPPVPIPTPPREDIGMHITLGMGGKVFPPRADNKFPPTYEFYQRKEQLMKTRRYLFNDARPLCFDCIEINDREDNGAISWAELKEFEKNAHQPGYGTMMVPNTIRRNCLIYHIADYCLEIQLGYWPNQPQKYTEIGTILKRSKLQKNWREATKGKKEPTFFEPLDFKCGRTVDLYGRHYFLVSADAYTQSKYMELGVTQPRIPVEMQVIPPIVHPIPQLGDGNLAIGKAEETLATVYGQKLPKEFTPFQERNRGRQLVCRMSMVSDRIEDQNRIFSLTYDCDNDNIGIHEEVVRNSGIWGGSFLNKGSYLNYLPDDGERARHFKPQDIYLGNIISPNNVMFRIIEMDAMTLKFQEMNPDDFPYSDTFEIVLRLLDEVSANAINARQVCKLQDKRHIGCFDKDQFVSMIDAFISSSKSDDLAAESLSVATAEENHRTPHKKKYLNDHELLTILRRFQDKEDLGKYHYGELCDLFSHIYYIRDMRQRAPETSARHTVSSVDELEAILRPSRTQWRRLVRLDEKCIYGIISILELDRIFTKNRVQLSEQCLQEIVARFPASKRETSKYQERMGITATAVATTPIGSSDASSVVSTASHATAKSTATRGTISSLIQKKKAGGGLLGLSAKSKTEAKVEDMRATTGKISIHDKRKDLFLSTMRSDGKLPSSGKPRPKNGATIRMDLERAVVKSYHLFDELFKAEWAF